MSDLISRQAALDALKGFDVDIIPYEHGKMYVQETLNAIHHRLSDLPSAEPDRKWIPCNERLPLRSEHVDDMVLVCYGNGSIRFDACMNGEWVHGNPIAWMPLPEPWRGE